MEATDPAAAASAAIEAARDLQRGVRAPGTERAYRSDWTHFAAFCRAAGFTPLPAAPETVAAYVASMERSHAYASVRRHLSAIARAHRLAGHADWQASAPEVRATLRGLARKRGRAVRRSAEVAVRSASTWRRCSSRVAASWARTAS